MQPSSVYKLLKYRGCCLVGLAAGLDASENTLSPLPGLQMILNAQAIRICNYFVLFVNGGDDVAFLSSETELEAQARLMPRPATTRDVVPTIF